jgi:type I restriction enzyme S subunit
METNNRIQYYNTTIPKDWGVASLEDIVKKPIVYGIVQAGVEVSDGVPYIKSTDVGGNIALTSLSKTSLEIAEKYKRSEVFPSDIVFSLRGNIGELSIVPLTLPKANLTQGTARICVEKNKANNLFLSYILKSSEVYRSIIRASKGSTFSEISLGELRRIKVALPPLPEQRAIAKVLGVMDSAIDTNDLLIAQKELRKKWLMHNLLTGKKRLKGFSGHWNTCNAKDFLTQRNEQFLNSGQIPLFSLTIESGVTEKSERYEREFLVKDKGTKKYKVIYPDDIVFNPANLRWGAIAKHNRDFKVLLSPIYEVMTVKSGYDIGFITSLVSSPRQIAYYASIVEGTLIERMAVKAEPFLATKYLVPELEEQAAIAQVLQAADKEITLRKAKSDLLREQKKGMMQVLLTGKKRLKIE